MTSSRSICFERSGRALPPSLARATAIYAAASIACTLVAQSLPEELAGERAPDVAAWADAANASRVPRVSPVLLGRLVVPEEWAGVAVIEAPRVDAAPLLAEDATRAGPGVALRTGAIVELDAPINPAVDGLWMVTASGERVWRISVRACGAASVGVRLASFNLPSEATWSIAGADGVARAFDGLGPNLGEAFWAPAVAGDRVDVEYRQPASVDAAPDFVIDQVAHHYRPIADPAAINELGLESGSYGPRESLLLPCEVDVMCRSANAVARDSVGAMSFASGGWFYVCTGALLNDVDTNTFAAWFLTANHCISTQAEASTLTVYWFYQSGTCNGTVPGKGTVPTTIGSTLIATSTASDFAFLRLNDDVGGGQGLAGWRRTPYGGTVVGIHHPGGSFKRWSSGATTTSGPTCSGTPLTSFVNCDWTDGVIEPGSSGSPLFDNKWQVIGQLLGVCATNTPGCSNPQDYNNLYGRFDVSYLSFATHLSSIIPDDAYEPNDTAAAAKPLARGTTALKLVDFEDYFRFNVCAPGQYDIAAAYTESQMDLAIRVQTMAGATVATSNRSDGTELLRATLSPGDYVLRVWRTKRRGGDYTITLPRFNSADFNADGFLNFEDFDAFVVAFEAGQVKGDFNLDGFLTFEDFDAFIAAFGAGC